MLPLFKIRKLCSEIPEPDNNGIIRIHREEYDLLISSKPAAALRYIDDEDGETVTVGSSFELSQRLVEPAQDALKLPHRQLQKDKSGQIDSQTESVEIFHAFEVDRSVDVLLEWRAFHNRTVKDNSERLMIIGRSLKTENKPTTTCEHITPFPPEKPYRPLSGLSEELITNSLTPEGERQAEEAGCKLRSYARIQAHHPPSSNSHTEKIHLDRWASYGDPIGSFVKREWPYPAQEADSSINQQLDEIQNVPTDHKPLIEIFEAEFAKLGSSQSMIEKPLPQLGRYDTTALDTVARQLHNEKHEVEEDLFSNSVGVKKPVQTHREIVIHSLKSLGDGLGTLAASLRHRLPEVQQHLSSVHQKIPSQMDRALRTSLMSLTSVLEQVQSQLSRTQLSTRLVSAECEPNNPAEASCPKPFCSYSTNLTTPMNTGHNFKSPVTLCPLHPAERAPDSKICTGKSSSMSVGCANTNALADSSKGANISNETTSALVGNVAYEKCEAFAEYRVQELVGRRFISYGSRSGPLFTQYLVRWCGCTPDEDTWYDASNLKDCGDLIQAYERENPRSQLNLFTCSENFAKVFRLNARELHIRTSSKPMMVYLSENESANGSEAENDCLMASKSNERGQSSANYELANLGTADCVRCDDFRPDECEPSKAGAVMSKVGSDECTHVQNPLIAKPENQYEPESTTLDREFSSRTSFATDLVSTCRQECCGPMDPVYHYMGPASQTSELTPFSSLSEPTRELKHRKSGHFASTVQIGLEPSPIGEEEVCFPQASIPDQVRSENSLVLDNQIISTSEAYAARPVYESTLLARTLSPQNGVAATKNNNESVPGESPRDVQDRSNESYWLMTPPHPRSQPHDTWSIPQDTHSNSFDSTLPQLFNIVHRPLRTNSTAASYQPPTWTSYEDSTRKTSMAQEPQHLHSLRPLGFGSDKVALCVQQLNEMGYGRLYYTEGCNERFYSVAAVAKGDLNEAIDILEDDHRARQAGFD